MLKHCQNKKYVLFHPKQKFIIFNNNITLDDVSVKQVEVTKFLGVLIDQHLSWKSHISYVAKKISKTIGIISKSRFYLSRKSLLSLYYTFAYPYLNYCNIVWSSNYPSDLNRLLLLASTKPGSDHRTGSSDWIIGSRKNNTRKKKHKKIIILI